MAPSRAGARRRLALLSLAVLGAGCASAAARLGETLARARAHAGEALGAVASRLGPLRIDDAFADFRTRITTAAFVPSRVFDDERWTGVDGPRRSLGLVGRPGADGYELSLSARPPAPRRPGEYRMDLTLEELGESEYEWRWADELALGAAPPEAFAGALEAIFSGLEERGEDPRRRLLASLPRASRALGRLATLERLEPAHAGDGTTAVTFRATLHPERIEEELPAYARYLEKYLRPVELNLQAYDLEGERFWAVGFRDLTLTALARVHRGALTALAGPPRRQPERLRVVLDLSTRSGMFRVGFRDLVGDVTLERAPWTKAFDAVWRRDPGWRIPFVVEPFIRSTLRRPFEGEGMWLRVSLDGDPGGPTRVGSAFRMAVKESWLVRHLGGLVTGAAGEFREKVEKEADRYHREVLLALREDVATLLADDAAAVAADADPR